MHRGIYLSGLWSCVDAAWPSKPGKAIDQTSEGQSLTARDSHRKGSSTVRALYTVLCALIIPNHLSRRGTLLCIGKDIDEYPVHEFPLWNHSIRTYWTPTMWQALWVDPAWKTRRCPCSRGVYITILCNWCLYRGKVLGSGFSFDLLICACC